MKDRVIRDLRTEIIEKAQKIDHLKAKVRQLQNDLHDYIIEVDKEKEAERIKKSHLQHGQLVHHAESNNKIMEVVGGSHSPRRGGTLGNSPSNGGLTNKYSKYSIQERMRKYKSDFETK